MFDLTKTIRGHRRELPGCTTRRDAVVRRAATRGLATTVALFLAVSVASEPGATDAALRTHWRYDAGG